jgi:hypothetical protein
VRERAKRFFVFASASKEDAIHEKVFRRLPAPAGRRDDR